LVAGLETGDINGDGKLDLVAGYNPVVYLGNGNGTFVEGSVNWEFGAGLQLTDINGDGKLDVFGRKDGWLRILLGNGDGTFATAKFYANDGYSLYTSKMVVGDWNGDGKPEIISGNWGGKGLDVYSVP
jgi:hypothetical protein